MTTLWIACLWAVFAPLSYLVTRRCNRALFGGWTQNDRLYALASSVFLGPLMLLATGIMVLVDKLGKSKWGNREARW